MLSFRFHHHNIVLLFSVIMLYFSPISCCTSIRHNIVLPSVIMLYFPSWLIFMQNYEGPYTFLNSIFILFVLTVMYFRHYNVVLVVIKVVLYIFMRDHVYFPRLDICTS
jgi:hypothetical protein